MTPPRSVTYIGPFTTLPQGQPVGVGPARPPCGEKRTELPEIGKPVVDLEAIAQYIKAKALTKLLGNVSLPVIEARVTACVSGGPEGGPCPWLRQKHSKPDPIGYCGACKCGSREEAALSKKVEMRGLTLPKGCLWSE